MSRSVGLSVLHSNFETRIAAPLDSRMLVDALADLHATATWQSGDGSYYAYKGMIVSVVNDTEENNGVYRLAALPYTTSSNWVKLGSGTGTGFTWYPDDTPPDVPEIGDAYHSSTAGASLVWDGTEWQTVAADGVDGIEPMTVLPSPVVALAGKVYFLTADDGTKKAGTTWKCVADGESYVMQQIQTDLSSLTDTTGILAGKVDKVTDYGLSKNDYTDAAVAKVAKIDLETLTELTGTEVTVAPWTQSKWSASGTCSLTATGWAESGRQAAYIVITLAAGSTPSVVGTEEVEDGDALSAAGVYECFLKNVDGKIYFRQISFTGAVA